MCFELGHVDEEIGLGYWLGGENIVPQSFRVGVGNLDLLALLESGSAIGERQAAGVPRGTSSRGLEAAEQG